MLRELPLLNEDPLKSRLGFATEDEETNWREARLMEGCDNLEKLKEGMRFSAAGWVGEVG